MKNWIRLFIYDFTKCAMGMFVSGPILTAKAKILYKKLYGNSNITDMSGTKDQEKFVLKKCCKTKFQWVLVL